MGPSRIFLFLVFLTPVAVLGSPGELLSAKRAIRHASRMLAEQGIDHQRESQIFAELESKIGKAELTDGEVIELVSYSTNSSEGRMIVRRYASYAVQEERKAAENSGLETFDFYDSHERLREVVVNEASMVPKISEKKILFIGGGPLPYSALFAQSISETSVTICDCNPETLLFSKKFIEGMGLDARFQFRIGRAQELDVSEYDLVWLAAMLEGKAEALRALHRTLRPNTFVLLRQFEGRGEALFGTALTNSQLSGYTRFAETSYSLSDWCVRAILLRRD